MDKFTRDTTIFFQKGTHPSILLLSGMHGDEFRVIESLITILQEHEAKIPDFIFIPQVSPSAVKQKTRLNSRGVDLNRIFTDDVRDEEGVALLSIIQPYHFPLCLSFHEDLDSNSFYMYDSGRVEDGKLEEFRATLKRSNIPLFSGIDDPQDPVLGCTITDGYYSVQQKYTYSDGFFMDYVIRNKICDRFITLEIPGTVNREENLRITSEVFQALRKMINF